MIDLIKVSKFYSGKNKVVKAIDNISVTINKGEIICIVGKNGAGKTTLCKLISSIIFPTKGNILINNKQFKLSKNNQNFKISYFQNDMNGFYNKMNIKENIIFYSSIQRQPYDLVIKKLDFLFNYFDLNEQSNNYFNNLSTGMKQKVKFILSIINNPDLIILDEFTNGVDTRGILKMIEILKFLNQKNKTSILFTTHHINDINLLADKIILLEKGSIEHIIEKTKFIKEYNNYNCYIIEYPNKKIINYIEKENIKILNYSTNEIKFICNNDSKIKYSFEEKNVKKIELDFFDFLDIILKKGAPNE